jgi:carboxyl-terminal processing protease
MLPASNKGVGMNVGFPDVCLTPAVPSPIPIPYPNMGMHAMAAPFCPTILLTMVPALNMGSIIPMTMGDEPGVASPFKGPGMFTMGNPKVFLQGLPAISLTCPTTGNNMINPVGLVAVPSATNVLFTCTAGEGREASSAHDLIAMADWLARAPEAHARPGGAGETVVTIPAFRRGTAAAVRHELAKAREGDRVVFDVRGNPGGDLAEAIELLRDLLPHGAEIARIVDEAGDEVVHRARGDHYACAMTVLVDARTASAAEIFAGCLRVHGRAEVVGGPTFGKQTAQAIGPDARGTAVARTVATVRLPAPDVRGGAR